MQKQREEGEEDQNKGGRGTAQLGGGGWWGGVELMSRVWFKAAGEESVGRKEKGDCRGQIA